MLKESTNTYKLYSDELGCCMETFVTKKDMKPDTPEANEFIDRILEAIYHDLLWEWDYPLEPEEISKFKRYLEHTIKQCSSVCIFKTIVGFQYVLARV